MPEFDQTMFSLHDVNNLTDGRSITESRQTQKLTRDLGHFNISHRCIVKIRTWQIILPFFLFVKHIVGNEILTEISVNWAITD